MYWDVVAALVAFPAFVGLGAIVWRMFSEVLDECIKDLKREG